MSDQRSGGACSAAAKCARRGTRAECQGRGHNVTHFDHWQQCLRRVTRKKQELNRVPTAQSAHDGAVEQSAVLLAPQRRRVRRGVLRRMRPSLGTGHGAPAARRQLRSHPQTRAPQTRARMPARSLRLPHQEKNVFLGATSSACLLASDSGTHTSAHPPPDLPGYESEHCTHMRGQIHLKLQTVAVLHRILNLVTAELQVSNPIRSASCVCTADQRLEISLTNPSSHTVKAPGASRRPCWTYLRSASSRNKENGGFAANDASAASREAKCRRRRSAMRSMRTEGPLQQ